VIAKESLFQFYSEQLKLHRQDPSKYDDGMSLMLKYDAPEFPDRSKLTELHHFVFAGLIASNAIANGLTRIIQTDGVEKQLRDEICLMAASVAAPITLKALNDYSYLANTTQESLRLDPIVPFFNGIAKRDIAFNGLVIPKGTVIFSALHTGNVNPVRFPSPERFNPDRFKSSDAAPICTFGLGDPARTHKCPGYRLADNFVALALLHLFSAFHITLKDHDTQGLDPKGVIQKPKGDLKVILKKL
jgi:cytochrome P450